MCELASWFEQARQDVNARIAQSERRDGTANATAMKWASVYQSLLAIYQKHSKDCAGCQEYERELQRKISEAIA